MQTAICLLPVVPMRKEPSHRSEMVSQILFGEYVTTTEEKEDFVTVKCLCDGYEGWVQANQLTPVNEVLETTRYIGCAQGELLVGGHRKMVSIGTPVYRPGEELRFGNTVVKYPVDETCVLNSKTYRSQFETGLENICRQYLHTPYLWGGKSIYGIDCSGFVQQVVKLFGVPLLRDAYLQAGQGESVQHLEEARLGDLAFFQNENGKVTHVGIVLNDHAIIHASGRVRIDNLDANGIINEETQKRTHRFHSLKRFF